jgi:hypothetical protein
MNPDQLRSPQLNSTNKSTKYDEQDQQGNSSFNQRNPQTTLSKAIISKHGLNPNTQSNNNFICLLFAFIFYCCLTT